MRGAGRWAAAGLLGFTALFAAVGMFYTPYDPNAMSLVERFALPNAKHWLGTDHYGRDVLSRMMDAAGHAYVVAVGAVGFGMAVGGLIGSTAGYVKGWVGELAIRIVDGLYAFPSLLLALLIVTVLGAGEFHALLAIGVFNVPVFARLAYSTVLETKQAGYVRAAVVYGASRSHILLRHLFPAVLPKFAVQAAASFSLAILTEASLSFLGLGVQLPNASWGTMLEESRKYISIAPWFPFVPGIAILMTALGANLLADSYRKGGGRHV
ncbi:ABC transporter permease [Paenibacillus turpanensis]|uniref:ABC transporter permease n=1 Tax=Paenibacillus turpanensis TaxID=2689078 RepID=UPI00140E79DA|nr:ABC transporter permease [Paenibacillus turpanensis]